MTTEEKARAYDEALKCAKMYYKENKDYNAEFLPIIFPELRESEDEMVRKSIIHILQVGGYMSSEEKGKALAYLEKQKYDRMQPIYDNQESFESALDKAWKSYNDSGARTVDGCEDNYTECAYAKGFREGYLFGLEKKKESENVSASTMIPSCWEVKQKEQKPAEWSEEDEKMLRTIISDGSRGVELDSKQISWLKSIRPVSKESLQSWKPSEEQMAMLLAVINDSNNAGAESCQLALRELYEQLKKLKGG